jgi:hypothetical protein
MTDPDLVGFFKAVYPNGSWPAPFHILEGLQRIAGGESTKEAAKAVHTLPSVLTKLQGDPDAAYKIIGVKPSDLTEEDVRKAATILGGLVLGQAAEAAFEDIYRSEMGQEVDFELKDIREGYTDTDYRVLNGKGRAIYRLNIKFFGSVFRRGAELVGLDPEDCFPLATYKILSALEKQDSEHLPYVFTVVGVPNLTAISLREHFSEEDIRIIALITKSSKVSGKRALEEKLVTRIVEGKSKAYVEAYNRIRAADWYVLSARKAYEMLKSMFVDRVYALRVRNFTRQFGGAEVDMHFSLKKELANLKELFRVLREEGPTKTASLLERGTM